DLFSTAEKASSSGSWARCKSAAAPPSPARRHGAPGRLYPSAVPRTRIPDDVLSLAHERAAARGAKDWAAADRIRAEIEAAGWKIVDRGTDFALEPIHAPTLADGGVIRYGSSEAVPSRLDEAPTGVATVILVATDWPDDLARALDGLRAHPADGTGILVMADGPSSEQDAALPAERDGLEVIRTSS